VAAVQWNDGVLSVQIADFKTAAVEPGGGLQQGRYVPKGEQTEGHFTPRDVMGQNEIWCCPMLSDC